MGTIEVEIHGRAENREKRSKGGEKKHREKTGNGGAQGMQ